MRTTTLLLAAALTTAGIAAYAQSNVYSVNVVGYVNVTVPANEFAMIANPLNSTNNTLVSLIPNPTPGTKVYKYNGGYDIATFDADDLVWDKPGNTLNPGEGAFVRNFAGTPMTITFVGEVLQGNLTNNVPASYSIRASKVPQAGLLQTALGYTPDPGSKVYLYNTAKTPPGYDIYTFDADDLVWDTEPSLAVGQAFFALRFSGADWVRTFSVP